MKTIKITLAALLLSVFTFNAAFSATDGKDKQLKKEHRKVTQTIVNSLYKSNFIKYVDESKTEKLDVFVRINDDNTVEVEKITGTNDDLNKLAKKIVENKGIKTAPGLEGKRMAVRLEFKEGE